MGASFSYLAEEKFTWLCHCILFDEETRTDNLHLIDSYFPDDSEILLCETDASNGGLDYRHFFISNEKKTKSVEFSVNRLATLQSADIYDTYRVHCNTLSYAKYDIRKGTLITPAIKERMAQLMGMCNYSLCLRNSEHVANYIFSGFWASLQMEGVLWSYFGSKMTEDQRKRINTFPSVISPKTVANAGREKLYSIIDQQYTSTKFQYFSDGNDDSYNILVAGKTKISFSFSHN